MDQGVSQGADNGIVAADYEQRRVTASFRRKDGRTLHVRKATRAEQPQLKIYTALDLHPAPGGVTKLIV